MWRPRPISFDYYDYSDVRHKPARVDLVSCGVGDPQVKLFPRALRTPSNGQEWKWISSVGCKITSIYHHGYICNLDLRFTKTSCVTNVTFYVPFGFGHHGTHNGRVIRFPTFDRHKMDVASDFTRRPRWTR